jgi:hypothetical protein
VGAAGGRCGGAEGDCHVPTLTLTQVTHESSVLTPNPTLTQVTHESSVLTPNPTLTQVTHESSVLTPNPTLTQVMHESSGYRAQLAHFAAPLEPGADITPSLALPLDRCSFSLQLLNLNLDPASFSAAWRLVAGVLNKVTPLWETYFRLFYIVPHDHFNGFGIKILNRKLTNSIPNLLN